MKVAILTGFTEMLPGYSLTGIVKDQLNMILDWGCTPVLFVRENYNSKYDYDLPPGVELRKVVPNLHMKDYQSLSELTDEHRQIVDKLRDILIEELADINIAFTHDWVFQGWLLPFGLAVQRATLGLPNTRWLHWIHSVPSQPKDFWRLSLYGNRHWIVYPNETDRQRVANIYQTTLDRVRVINHIKDPRSFFDFHRDTLDFIRDHRGIMSADIVQVYPASADRLSSKQIDKVIHMFAEFKRAGMSVFLLIPDAHATTTRHREDEEQYLALAEAGGLSREEVVFVSHWREGQYGSGLPKRILRDLMLLSNVFIFPTVCETFGLVGPEAALTGNFLVTNRSLNMQGELWQHLPVSYDFGAFNHNVQHGCSWQDYCSMAARETLSHIGNDKAFLTRTIARQSFNWDYLFNRKYAPLFEELMSDIKRSNSAG